VCRNIFVIHAEGVEMVSASKTNVLIRIRNVLCLLFLILAILCEAYSVAAIALDQFAPSWYRTLGWLFFILPFALTSGLLLLYANRRRLGFYLSAMSFSLYAGLVCLDAYQGPAERGDWIFEVAWLAFCAIGILAAKALMCRPMRVSPTDAQECSS
jgi:hypothetical protein